MRIRESKRKTREGGDERVAYDQISDKRVCMYVCENIKVVYTSHLGKDESEVMDVFVA